MNKCIVFDANFLYENKNFGMLFDSKKDDEDYFVTEIVINEIKSKNDRALKDMYNKYDEIVNSNLNQVYFKLKNKIDMNLMYDSSSKKIQEYFDLFFKENIIRDYSKEKMYDDLMERVRFKKAPFVDKENSSDKGFKDTLIWMSFLNYVNESKYLDYILVTNDKGFIANQKEELIQEFQLRFPFKKLNIISNNDFIKNHSSAENEDKQENKDKNPIINEKQVSVKKISEQLIQDAKNSINSFFYYTVYGNPYDYQVYEEYRFVLNKRPNYNEVIDFIDSLIAVRDDYTFHDYVDIQAILKDLGYQYVEQRDEIPIMVFNQFINIFMTIKNDYHNSFDAFVQFCIDNFCDIKIVESELDEDLPF